MALEFDRTLEQYDRVIEKMHFTPGGPGAPGGLFHWCTATDGGIRITAVWESRKQFEQFAEQQIGPLTAEVGDLGPPKMTLYDVHNYLTAREREVGQLRTRATGCLATSSTRAPGVDREAHAIRVPRWPGDTQRCVSRPAEAMPVEGMHRRCRDRLF